MSEESSQILRDRLEKLKRIKDEGINPYPSKTNRTSSIVDVLNSFNKLKKKKVTVAGRIKLLRPHGKTTFMNVEDATSSIQLYFKEDDLSKTSYKKIKNFDVGDFIEATGKLFLTKTKEKTIAVNDFNILAKSLRPLPEKWHGLKDREVRYRKRYLDLVVNPKSKDIFIKRFQIIEEMRQFLISRGFIEVDTPVLQPIYGGGLAKPFTTHHNELDLEMYLRISAELYLKRLIVGGFENVFEFGRIFRNEGVDLFHNPEFTLMETMSAYYDYEDNMKLTEDMISNIVKKVCGKLKIKYQGQAISMKPPYKRITVAEAIKKYAEFDIKEMKTIDEAKKKAKEIKVDIEGIETIGGIATRVFEKKVENNLIEPTFVHRYPVESSPLAKRCTGDDRFVERFEFFIIGQEFSNNYSELNDPQELKKRFIEEKKKLISGDEEAHQTDNDFLEAVEYGMPPTSGLGIGIDRLVMLLTDQSCIRDVIFFPTMKPLGSNGDSKKTDSLKSESVGVPEAKEGDPGIQRDDAIKLMEKNIKTENYRYHLLATEAVMRALARKFGKNEDLWGITGLLHDLDWEQTEKEPRKHGKITVDILKSKGVSPAVLSAIPAHNYEYTGKERKTDLDFALTAGELITGLIVACALVRPDKKLSGVKTSSVKKKFRDKSFAAKVSRDDIRDIERLGIPLDDFIELSLVAMKNISDDINL